MSTAIKNTSENQAKDQDKVGSSKQRAVGKIKSDVHEKITNSIINAIENGTDAFQMPWNKINMGLPINVKSGNSYNGINILSLWIDSLTNGYISKEWGTYKQWAEKGAQVKKGETGTQIVFYKQFGVVNKDTGEEEARRIAKGSTVFNACQVDGYESETIATLENKVLSVDELDIFITNTGAKISTQGEGACFIPSQDKILMPEKVLFKGTKNQSATDSYYAVLLHELTHWTGGKSRLDRKRLNDNKEESYAFEELVAELGSAFLCSEIGLRNNGREDHAAYITSWLKALKNDNKFIFKAAAQASAAVAMLKGLQPS